MNPPSAVIRTADGDIDLTATSARELVVGGITLGRTGWIRFVFRVRLSGGKEESRWSFSSYEGALDTEDPQNWRIATTMLDRLNGWWRSPLGESFALELQRWEYDLRLEEARAAHEKAQSDLKKAQWNEENTRVVLNRIVLEGEPI